MNDVRKLLSEAVGDAKTVAVLGCGSVLRGDDAAGMEIARRLSGLGGRAQVYEGSNAPENFTGEIKKFHPDALLIFDAARMNRQPGEVAIVSPDEIDGVSFSTHTLPLKIMTDYLEREIGCRISIVGIEGVTYQFWAEMSPEAVSAVDSIVSELTGLLA